MSKISVEFFQYEACLLGRLARVVLLALWSPATYVRGCTSYVKLDTTRAQDYVIFITEAKGNKKWCPHALLDTSNIQSTII